MKNRGWKGLVVAALCLIAVLLIVGCAESSLKKEIAEEEATLKSAEAAAALARARAEELEKQKPAVPAAEGAAANVPMGLPAHPSPTASPPIEELLAAARAEAKKHADEAAAARARLAELQAKVDAARAKDDSAWGTVQGIASGAAGLGWGPIGSAAATGIVGLIAGLVRGKREGQVDGAGQVAQSVATLRRLSPEVDQALNKVGPLLKALVKSSMDEHVAAAVAKNKDTIAPDAAPAVLATVGPAPAAAAAA